MDYTPNIDAQGMRRPMGPVDQPNWNGGPKLIHKVVKPEYWILAEEWVCNFIADYGAKIFSIAYSVLGNDAWMFIPYELDKVIA